MLNELDRRWTLAHGPGPEDEEVYRDDPYDEKEAEDFEEPILDAYDDEDDTDDEVDHFYDNEGKLVHDTFDDDEDE